MDKPKMDFGYKKATDTNINEFLYAGEDEDV